MSAHFDSPFSVFAMALVVQGLAAFVGDFLRKRAHSFKQGERHDFNTVQAATLTLLALIIGFTFSMAVTRTISARRWRRPKPTPSLPNICAPICCPGTMGCERGNC